MHQKHLAHCITLSAYCPFTSSSQSDESIDCASTAWPMCKFHNVLAFRNIVVCVDCVVCSFCRICRGVDAKDVQNVSAAQNGESVWGNRLFKEQCKNNRNGCALHVAHSVHFMQSQGCAIDARNTSNTQRLWKVYRLCWLWEPVGKKEEDVEGMSGIGDQDCSWQRRTQAIRIQQQ